MYKIAQEVRELESAIRMAGGEVHYSFRTNVLTVKRGAAASVDQLAKIDASETRLLAIFVEEPDNTAAALETCGCAW